MILRSLHGHEGGGYSLKEDAKARPPLPSPEVKQSKGRGHEEVEPEEIGDKLQMVLMERLRAIIEKQWYRHQVRPSC